MVVVVVVVVVLEVEPEPPPPQPVMMRQRIRVRVEMAVGAGMSASWKGPVRKGESCRSAAEDRTAFCRVEPGSVLPVARPVLEEGIDDDAADLVVGHRVHRTNPCSS